MKRPTPFTATDRPSRLKSLALAALFAALCPLAQAQNTTMNPLTQKQQHIASAAAQAARGDQDALKEAIAAGLDSGVTVNEFKEVFVQLYAYCGFPRSLNALATFKSLLEERGGKDAAGPLPGPRPAGNSLDFGTVNQTKLVGAPVKGAIYEFAPAIDEFLKAHLFGDIFCRDNLDWQTREVATIAMLAAMKGVDSQLQGHVAIGKHNGLTDEQTQAIVALAERKPGRETPEISPFPTGNANTGYARYFSGRSWLAPMTQDQRLGVPVANVTFEPGCRNNWHSHTGGQLLIAVGGVGYYQERGQAARRLLPGEIVEIAPNVEHWHGAAPTSWFAHLAVECNPQTNQNTWLEPVSDAEYRAATTQP